MCLTIQILCKNLITYILIYMFIIKSNLIDLIFWLIFKYEWQEENYWTLVHIVFSLNNCLIWTRIELKNRLKSIILHFMSHTLHSSVFIQVTLNADNHHSTSGFQCCHLTKFTQILSFVYGMMNPFHRINSIKHLK